ncbi:tRNA pseudouridine(38/39) synthase [Smittium mucronatum]|uniref:tRNA pseudouridine(38/39) synthase n=1 Tax=Smittium mucronatum TaxID=133383 RepID=A0A1R0H9E4_9FUNG|nr:tRNA pseudouridine(38/39) synthase [Smittium mucronatum]
MASYNGWSKARLISRIASLEKLVGAADSATSTEISSSAPSSPLAKRQKKSKGTPREFDFDKYPKRKIALKLSYLGCKYYGFARQGNVSEKEEEFPTVEGELFKSLIKCRLVLNEASCGYSRCGRTDRGVSALGQVISLYVRSNGSFVDSLQDNLYIDSMNGGRPVKLPQDSDEYPYTKMINKNLPPEIRVLGWCPVESDFDARFSCKSRQYRYLFQAKTLDLDAMIEGAKLLVGTRDFRNFCKVDLSKNIENFERTILEAEIEQLDSTIDSDWYQFRVRGTAFLWHQVRCMMAILFLIGQRLETSDIIEDLTNPQKFNGKPEYEMASDLPLFFDSCDFKDGEKKWIYYSKPTDLSSLRALSNAIIPQYTETFITLQYSRMLMSIIDGVEIPSSDCPSPGSVKSPTPGTKWEKLINVNDAGQNNNVRVLIGGGKQTPYMSETTGTKNERMAPPDSFILKRLRVVKISPEYENGSKPFSYLFKYSSDYDISIKLVRTGWSYAVYSDNIIAFAPPQSQRTQQLDIDISGNDQSDDYSFAVPQSISILNSNDVASHLVGFTLTEKTDYTVSLILNKNIFVKPDNSSESASTTSSTPSPTESAEATSINGTYKSDPIFDSMQKYFASKTIPGNHNYDNTLNPYGIQLVGPFIGLYIYSSIFIIALVFFTYGSLNRATLRSNYYRMLSTK